jgi:hypothetical protein
MILKPAPQSPEPRRSTVAPLQRASERRELYEKVRFPAFWIFLHPYGAEHAMPAGVVVTVLLLPREGLGPLLIGREVAL